MRKDSFIAKALNKGLTLPNIVSYLSLETMRLWGRFWGTIRLRLKAYILGIPVGRGTCAHGSVGLLRFPGSRITIGSHVSFISSWRRATAASLTANVRLRTFASTAHISIGDNCELSGTSITARSCPISLGKSVLIGPNCVITDSDFHAPLPVEKRADNPGFERDRPVCLDDHVWIGMNVCILKGVHIGRGAIIGAGSVVTRDIPAFAVACGNPARVVRMLDQSSEEC